MSIEIKSPTFPESVQDGTIAAWHVAVGEAVRRDQPLVDIETDKVVLEVVAPADGVLEEVVAAVGETVAGNQVIGRLKEGAAAAKPASKAEEKAGEKTAAPAAPAKENASATSDTKINPAAKRMIEEKNLDAAAVSGSGKGGRITKGDVINHLESGSQPGKAAAASVPSSTAGSAGREEKRVPMSRLRARIAERLLQASQTTAMLTTFNEVNMQPLMELRSRYKEPFEKAHGVRLGFMSLFVRACAEALKRFPAVNASIDGDDIVYHGYQDIGVAVSSDRGLVVPILRDTGFMSLAQIEARINEFGQKAKSGQLTLEEMTGGTFTISNGGVFGSLMSTPILNPPQAAILGMHAIKDRPVVENGEIVIRPMMYLALSYDHRLIDGKEAVQFLVAIKEMVEDPARILLEL